ncbi:hypothetical protein [Cellulomonas sp. URHB0016]
MTKVLADYTLGAPEDWGGWTPGNGLAEADEVAELLADGDAARARVREAVLTFDKGLGDDRAVLNAAVWVPDRATGELGAFLRVDLLELGGQTADEWLRTQRRPRRERGVKVFHWSTDLREMPAGQASVVVRTWAHERTKVVVADVVWTLFPDGSSQGLQLEFTAASPELADTVGHQSVTVVETVNVVLEDAQ